MRNPVRITPRLLSACSIALLLAAVPVAAQSSAKQPIATLPRVNLALTWSGQHALEAGTGNAFWLQGGSAEVGVHAAAGLSLVGNFTIAHRGSGALASSLDVFTLTAGPRYTLTGRQLHASPRFGLFAETLAGMSHGYNSLFPTASGVYSSASSFALLTGGGADLHCAHRFALRLIEVDYMRSGLPNGFGNVQNNLRVASGISYSLWP